MFEERGDPSLFRQVLEHGLQYMYSIPDRRVFPEGEAIAGLSHFEEPLPELPAEAKAVLHLLQQQGAPATVATTGARYFGFVTGNMVPAGQAAKLLATFWDQVSAMYVLSPLAAKLEQVVEGWLRTSFHLPGDVVAGFVSGSSVANLCGLAAGRYRLLQNQGWDVNRKGLAQAPPLRIVLGKEAHSTILKMVSLLGFGLDCVEWVETDAQGRIIPEQIPELDSSTLLVLQAGNVNSGAFDDFGAICRKAKEKGAWIHIDGAFGLWAAAVDSLKALTVGIEYADSWAVDGHKTLNTPYDSGIILCADQEALSSALHMSAGYIILSDHRDGMLYTPEMSRRARIVELWATMKYLGVQGIDQMIHELHRRAVQFAEGLASTKGFTVLNDVVFNQVAVACENDERTDQVLARIQQDGTCWVGGSFWKGRRIIRISVCSWMTTTEDIQVSIAAFQAALHAVEGSQA